ncbi:FAD-dependent oxidoreductase [Pendulispora brunnea]|uniref:FAD-dependent oxidoreductase n=1 Tax=Pendulispora brunnea TaxID=2905690 RepID=A0ABZ2KGW0_9BACT
MTGPLRIAVVGGGVAGITAAHLLQRKHIVTLYERDRQIGGHANAARIEEPLDGHGASRRTVEVDTAFLIFHSGSYPLFMQLLREWGLQDRCIDVEMSFGFLNQKSGLRYTVNRGIGGAFVQPHNVLRPRYLRLLAEIYRFRRSNFSDLEGDEKTTLGEYLRRRGYSESFIEDFIFPMGVSVWSLPLRGMLSFPAATFARFFAHNRMLKMAHGARWQTLRGGSRQYIRAFLRNFRGQVETGYAVQAVRRPLSGRPRIVLKNSREHEYDRVVIATHADDALRLLRESATAKERRLLGAWRYSAAKTVLHTDASVLPGNNLESWGSWNVVYTPGADATVTYDITRIQRPANRKQYFVTIGDVDVNRSKVLHRYEYRHPLYDARAIATQRHLWELNTGDGVLYCGSYFGRGFHEDAIRSASHVAEGLGVEW